MPGWFKKIVILLVIGGAGYAGYKSFFAQGPAGGGPGGMPPGGAAPVSVAKVIGRDVNLWSEFSGRLVAVDRADVRPRVSGTIEAIHFKDGTLVNKGDLLFTLDSRPYIAEVDRAAGQLASAQAQAQAARKESERASRLFKEKALSSREYDQRQSDINVADANVKSAEAALEVAKLNLDYAAIKAPVSGRVGRAEITVGNLVEGGMGNGPVLTTIVSSMPIYADFEMDEPTFLHYVGVTAGDVTKIPVELGLATETGAPHAGHVQSFDNRMDVASGTIRVRAVFDNPDGILIPGMFARILLGSAAPMKAILITDRAIGTDQNKKFVLVVGDDNKVEYREIKPGPAVDGLRIVEEGLKEDEKIIVNGLQRARPGAPVTPELVEMNAKEKP
jgi:multidrug efflux system membrane fusion protein